VTEPLGEPLYRVVTRDRRSGEVVLKVVNARPRSIRTQVELRGGRLSDRGSSRSPNPAR
jgi:hypothetical protein